ncbi:MAG: hypothetical protein JZU55_02365 [Afipia sp.]|nr:hypothetical protein [Afipia sp.]
MAAQNGLHFWRLCGDRLLSKQGWVRRVGQDSARCHSRLKQTSLPRFPRQPVADESFVQIDAP